MLVSSDLQAMIRALLTVIVTLGVVRLENGQIETLSVSLTVIVLPLVMWIWSRKNRKDLLYTDPVSGERLEKP